MPVTELESTEVKTEKENKEDLMKEYLKDNAGKLYNTDFSSFCWAHVLEISFSWSQGFFVLFGFSVREVSSFSKFNGTLEKKVLPKANYETILLIGKQAKQDKWGNICPLYGLSKEERYKHSHVEFLYTQLMSLGMAILKSSDGGTFW